MSKEAIEYLKHIRDECFYIVLTIKESGISKSEFVENETLKRAVVRSLEIIGEATKKIPIDEKLKYPTIHWKNMAGMRDKLIHDYIGVNYSIVWSVVENKIPELYEQITKVIEKE